MNKELKNSENYIISKVGKNNPFSVPKGYLNNVESNIFSKINEDSLPVSSGFGTPKNYFKELEDSILEKVSSTKKETKVITLKDRILKVVPFAAAASIILFIGLNTFVFNQNNEISIDNLTESDIEYWLNNSDIHDSDVALVLDDDILEENGFSLTNLKDENIEEYINSIDNSSLLNEIN